MTPLWKTAFRFAALPLILAGCDQPPSAASLKVWVKSDHHSSDDDKQAAGAQVAAAGTKAEQNGAGDAQLVDLAWRQQCTACHGPAGRGDGQMGPMLHAPDLTRADWQSSVGDAEMAATIKNGRNKMPRFDLPEAVLRGLVARIRSLRTP